jgi:hypothetical protein
MHNGLDSLKATLINDKETTAELTDLAIENISDVLENIPIVTWAVKAWNLKKTFQEKLLIRNIETFLNTYNNDKEKALNLIEKIRTDKKEDEFLDTFSLIMLNSEKPIKARIVANLFNSLLDEKLSLDEFDTLCLIVYNGSVPALEALKKYMTSPSSIGQNLTAIRSDTTCLIFSLGIINVFGSSINISDLGKNLFEYGLINI